MQITLSVFFLLFFSPFALTIRIVIYLLIYLFIYLFIYFSSLLLFLFHLHLLLLLHSRAGLTWAGWMVVALFSAEWADFGIGEFEREGGRGGGLSWLLLILFYL